MQNAETQNVAIPGKLIRRKTPKLKKIKQQPSIGEEVNENEIENSKIEEIPETISTYISVSFKLNHLSVVSGRFSY